MTTGPKILMIDDDVNLVNVFRMVCEVNQYRFFSAHSASEGLQRIKEVEPDLIILDVIMEDFVAGFRVVSELRASDPGSEYARFADIPILMLTSVTARTNVDFRDRVGTALLPVDAFMEKPVKPSEILARIAAILAARSSH